MFKGTYKGGHFVNAGEFEIYRFGHKAQEKLTSYLEANENGFISVPCYCGDWWSIGTSEGKYGEFTKFHDTFISVNKGGYAWAKAGTEKAEVLKDMINFMLDEMKAMNESRNNEEDE